jgi:predicted transcriptional regulator
MSDLTGAHDLAGLSREELLARFRFYWTASGAAALEARRLLAALSDAGMNWSELEDETGMSRPAVRRHVSTARHGGRTRVFGAKPSPATGHARTLLEQLRQAQEQAPDPAARRAP